MTDAIAWWGDMTTEEVASLVEEDPVVILPLAATEQHGPHLPLSTDTVIGTGLLASAFRQLPDGFPARSLPPQPVGASDEHARFPGTLSLGSEILGDLIHRIGSSLARHGVRRLLLHNSHGGNQATMDTVGLRLREQHGMLVIQTSYPRFQPPDPLGIPDSEWKHGLHGGAVETAMMLHLRPDLVQMSRARPAPSLGEDLERTMRWIGPESGASFSWLTGDLHPTGVVGDPVLASPEMGARLVAHYGQTLAQVVRETHAFPLERFA